MTKLLKKDKIFVTKVTEITKNDWSIKSKTIKNAIIHFRRTIKIIFTLALGLALICFLILFIYKPIYSVTLDGEFIGYSEDKSELQEKINNYMTNGDNENIVFVEIPTLPEYKMCLLKKGNETNDNEIFDKVISSGTAYYKYYAILDSGTEKYYVKTYEECEAIIEDLKAKESMNVDRITYTVKYETETKEFTDKETAVADLYVAKPVVKKASSSGSVNTKQEVSYAYADIGVSLIRPISGVITSRFGARSRGVHTGLDIATSTGTGIAAAAGGVVTYAGRKGSYGNLVVVSHGNGVETYYAHCSKMYVNAGMSVSQGQIIAAVGSTGNSTGPHLHLEVRVNGVAQNPQNYVY